MSAAEHKLLRFCKKAPLFAFLRRTRHELLDEEFQRELALMYATSSRGRPPVAPALLAMATVLQSALGVSDQEAARLAVTDRCWQMVLGTLESEEVEGAPFSQGALFDFRMRLITHGMDRRLLERTVAWARQSKQYSSRALRAAFDASGLWGCGRVEDTFNLIGHAARELVDSVAERLGLSSEEAAQRAGIELVAGSSLKAMLDIDWDDPSARAQALEKLLKQVEALQTFVRTELGAALAEPPFEQQLATLSQVVAQDLEPDPGGGGRLRIKRAVARERRISITDPQMRHGRKSKTKLINGYKRHVATDLEADLIVAAALSPANRPEGESAKDLFDDIERQGLSVEHLHIDRAYLCDPEVQRRCADGMQVHCRPFALRGQEGRFTKADFSLDFAAQTLTCPAGQMAPLRLGEPARFAAAICQPCPQREQCTASKRGRTVTIHAHEPMLVELRARQKTAEGRAALRRRVGVEHALAGVERTQGERARYKGLRKNLFDVRRHAAVQNIYEVMNLAA
jgi:hypothetical protein